MLERVLLPKLIRAPWVNPEPLMVSVNPGDPEATEAGESEVRLTPLPPPPPPEPTVNGNAFVTLPPVFTLMLAV